MFVFFNIHLFFIFNDLGFSHTVCYLSYLPLPLSHITVLPAAHRVEVCKVPSGKAVRDFPQLNIILKTSVFQG